MTDNEKLELFMMLQKDAVDHVEVTNFVQDIAIEAYTEGFREGRHTGYDIGFDDGRESVAEVYV